MFGFFHQHWVAKLPNSTTIIISSAISLYFYRVHRIIEHLWKNEFSFTFFPFFLLYILILFSDLVGHYRQTYYCTYLQRTLRTIFKTCLFKLISGFSTQHLHTILPFWDSKMILNGILVFFRKKELKRKNDNQKWKKDSLRCVHSQLYILSIVCMGEWISFCDLSSSWTKETCFCVYV